MKFTDRRCGIFNIKGQSNKNCDDKKDIARRRSLS